MAGLNSLSLDGVGSFLSELKKGVNSLSLGSENATFIALKLGLNSLSTYSKSTWIVKAVDNLGNLLTNTISINVINTENIADFYTISISGGYATISVFKDFTIDGNGFEVVDRFIDTDIKVTSADYSGSYSIINPTVNGGIITLVITEIFKSGGAFRYATTTIGKQITQQASSFCYCGGCDFEQKVFGLSGGEDYQNDKSPFLLPKSISTDTIVYKLYKDGSEVAVLDNVLVTLGDYYPTFTANPLYVGFRLYWELVIVAFGAGLYQVKTERSILGVSDVIESQKFRLQLFHEQLADNTVKIQAVHNGNHLSGINYIDLLEGGWIEEYRLSGRFVSKTAVSETDIYRSNNNIVKQIQGRENAEYVLELDPLPIEVWERIIFTDVMATEHFYITDYNIRSAVNKKAQSFERVDLIKSETEQEAFTDMSKFTMTFREREEGNVMSLF